MLEAYARGVNAWIAARGRFSAPEFLFLGTPEPWEPVGQPALGRDHGPVAVAQLAHRAVPPVAGRAQCRSRRSTNCGRRSRATAGPRPALAPALHQLASELADVLPRFPDALHPARQRLERMGGGRPSHRHRRAAARRRSRTSPSASPASGTWRASRRPTACWPAPPRRACRSWCSATTATSPGPSPPPAPTCRTCSSRRRPAPDEYQTPDGPRPFTVREERIKVRGEADQMLTVRETRHGPVVSDLTRPRRPDPGRADGQPRAGQHRRRRPARAQPGARRRRTPARPPP